MHSTEQASRSLSSQGSRNIVRHVYNQHGPNHARNLKKGKKKENLDQKIAEKNITIRTYY